MTLYPHLPMIDDESLTGYMGRIARFHGNGDVFDFVAVLEISRQSVMEPDDATLSRLAGLTGTSAARLRGSAIERIEGRFWRLMDECFYSDFANTSVTTFCPACLLEDGQPGSVTRGFRTGRMSWRLGPVRTCGRHGIALFRRPNADVSEKFQNMYYVAPEDDELRLLAEGSERRAVSPLQRYVENRFAKIAGPAWLDGQRIDDAARACEMLGVLLRFGMKPNLNQFTQTDWDLAGREGFAPAAEGPNGIHQALKDHFNAKAAAGVSGGPQAFLGRLYQWLQFGMYQREVGPIKDVVRDFILEHFSLEAGTSVFGVQVASRKKHSVQTLAKATGMHPKTVNRAVVLAGLVPQGSPGRPNDAFVFDADEGERLMARIQRSIPARDLASYINSNRMQAELLVREGIIPRLIEAEGLRTGHMKRVALDDVDAFMARFMGAAALVDTAAPGMVNVLEAAALSRWPIMDIVRAILDGTITKVEIVDPLQRFKAVLVDPGDVRQKLDAHAGGNRLTLKEAAEILELTTPAVLRLARTIDLGGNALLRSYTIRNGKGAERQVFDIADVEQFRFQHVKLVDFCRARSFGPKIMKMKLDNAGIEPILDRRGMGGFIYRREDLDRYEPV